MISVIVAAYNIEKYLPRAIDSILNQTIKDIELILVNDGSTDSSGKICEGYAKIDGRVKVVHKENGGLPSARNAGLDIANGDFISFVDGDDWIEQEMLEELLEPMMLDQDIVVSIGTHVLQTEAGVLKEVFKENTLGCILQPEICLQMLERQYWGWELCGKLYRRQLFEHFRCNEAIIHGEDLHSNWKLLRMVKKVYYLPRKRYHYCIRAASITRETFSERMLTLVDTFNEIDNEIAPDNSVLKKLNRNLLLNSCIDVLIKMFWLDPEKYHSKIRLYQELLKSKCASDEIALSEAQQQQVKILVSPFSVCKRYFADEGEKIADSLKHFSQKYKHIYIYGGGNIASVVAQIMNKEGIIFDAFIVSDRLICTLGPDNWHVVRQLSEIDLGKVNDNGIILAMNKKNTKEVSTNLQQYGFIDFFDIGDCNSILIFDTAWIPGT